MGVGIRSSRVTHMGTNAQHAGELGGTDSHHRRGRVIDTGLQEGFLDVGTQEVRVWSPHLLGQIGPDA